MGTAISVDPPDLALLPITVQMKSLEAGTDMRKRETIKEGKTSSLAHFHH